MYKKFKLFDALVLIVHIKSLHFFCLLDLRTMTERLERRYYVTRRLFIADMTRIFTNCMIYNLPETEYYQCAVHLQQYFQTKMKEIGLWDKWSSVLERFIIRKWFFYGYEIQVIFQKFFLVTIKKDQWRKPIIYYFYWVKQFYTLLHIW